MTKYYEPEERIGIDTKSSFEIEIGEMVKTLLENPSYIEIIKQDVKEHFTGDPEDGRYTEKQKDWCKAMLNALKANQEKIGKHLEANLIQQLLMECEDSSSSLEIDNLSLSGSDAKSEDFE